MEKNHKNRWVVIAIIAAIVAALTTVIVLVLFVGKSSVPAASGKPYVKSK